MDDSIRAEKALAGQGGLANLLFDAMTVVQESKEGMARIHRIARDLHSFSRVDDDANALSDVNGAVDSALTMLRSELRYRPPSSGVCVRPSWCGPAPRAWGRCS